jgi:hypothetical protein
LEGHLVAPKAEANLQLNDSYVVLGDNLEGTFTVSPREDIQVTEIRCEINCTETAQVMRNEYDPALKMTVTRQVTERRVLYSAKPTCNPATELVNGIARAFKFSVNIPAGARPTFMSAGDSVVWEIKGVVGVHGRPDVTSKEMTFQVIPESQRPANQAPKVRLVACQYCQAEMPEDALACPNCGGRKTAQ